MPDNMLNIVTIWLFITFGVVGFVRSFALQSQIDNLKMEVANLKAHQLANLKPHQ